LVKMSLPVKIQLQTSSSYRCTLCLGKTYEQQDLWAVRLFLQLWRSGNLNLLASFNHEITLMIKSPRLEAEGLCFKSVPIDAPIWHSFPVRLKCLRSSRCPRFLTLVQLCARSWPRGFPRGGLWALLEG
jgi:hypothetical protein